MSSDVRPRICEAAFTVAARDGLLSMTLDNVAKEAGVSKGGLTYHFPSKEVLIGEMLKEFGQRLEQQLASRVAADSEPRMRWARNILECALGKPSAAVRPADEISPELTERFMLTALAAVILQPDVLAPLLDVGLNIRKHVLAEPQGGMDQLLVWLAVDGLFLWRFLGVIDRDDALFDQIVTALRERAAPGDAEAATSSAAGRSLPQGATL